MCGLGASGDSFKPLAQTVLRVLLGLFGTDGLAFAGLDTTVERRYDGEIPCDDLRGGSIGGASSSSAEEGPAKELGLVKTFVGDYKQNK